MCYEYDDKYDEEEWGKRLKDHAMELDIYIFYNTIDMMKHDKCNPEFWN